jgi:transcription initiation factor IIE alpha subunit
LEVTDEELKEAMAIAMTVGATKIKILQESALASLTKKRPSQIQGTGEENTPSDSEVCSA